MLKLTIDIETHCDLDLTKVGVYRYVEHASFEVLWLAYEWNHDGDVVQLDVKQNDYKDTLRDWLTNPQYMKYASNAPFEVVCLSAWLGIPHLWEQWRCSQIRTAYLGLPFKLEKSAQVMGLPEQKDRSGKLLINYWSKPCNPTKVNGGRTRNLPHHHPEKWQQFGNYCGQDVRTESQGDVYCDRFGDLPALEWEYWQLDQRINDRGVPMDLEFVQACSEINKEHADRALVEFRNICGLGPKQTEAFKQWIFDRTGVLLTSIDKEFFKDFVPEEWPDEVANALQVRQLASRADKYGAFLRSVCADNRVRGTLQFYGANRTGREAGRIVQPQNMVKNSDNSGYIKAMAERLGVSYAAVEAVVGSSLRTAREAVLKRLVDVLYKDVPAIVGSLVRTAIKAPPGRMLAVCDFSAIEARVISWLAGEDWQLEVFRGDGRIYEATASRMFGVPVEQITKGHPLRAKGKVASLALGYEGGALALIKMGALREGLTEAELDPIKIAWRLANPNIKKFWKLLRDVAIWVIERRSSYVLRLKYTSLTFTYDRGYMFITLPSGRKLSYYGARVEEGAKGKRITYYGLNDQKQWVKLDTYGGKLAENVTQAIARDCLFISMLEMDRRGLEIIMHVHDEVVAECDEDKAAGTLKVMEDVMLISPMWAKDLPLVGDGFVSDIYRKD